MSDGNIGGFGLLVALIASSTYPATLTLDAFADDADPFDFPDIKVADIAMGLNGDLLTWSKAAPLMTNLAVIPESSDDTNLGVLLAANRVGKSKASAQDVITLIGKYPSGITITLSGGRITDGPLASSIASSGRMKSKVYKFAFQNITIARV